MFLDEEWLRSRRCDDSHGGDVIHKPVFLFIEFVSICCIRALDEIPCLHTLISELCNIVIASLMWEAVHTDHLT